MGLEIQNGFFRYHKKEKWILENISFSIEQEERVGIFAPSGRGKTTLCKVLAGYETLQKGSLLLEHHPLPQKGYCPVQMIWQHPEQAVDPKLSIEKILAEGQEISEVLLTKLGVQPQWFSRVPQTLSGGELQRVCIARALGKGTKFLLADEMTTMLDYITQSQIWHVVLEEVERRNIGLVVVSHDTYLLEKICTRMISLEL